MISVAVLEVVKQALSCAARLMGWLRCWLWRGCALKTALDRFSQIFQRFTVLSLVVVICITLQLNVSIGVFNRSIFNSAIPVNFEFSHHRLHSTLG
jgi:hypothetical protein